MTYTRLQFCQSILSKMNISVNDDFRVYWLCAWTVFESKPPNSASYNLLNTTLKADDSTNFNSIGVQNYSTYDEGITYTVMTIENGYYNAIVSALKSNDQTAGNYKNNFISSNLSTWGTGGDKTNYIYEIAQSMFSGYDKRYTDKFNSDGNINTVNVNSNNKNYKNILSINDLLYNIDLISQLNNPFNIDIPTITIFGSTIGDPVVWLTEFGNNMMLNLQGIAVRTILIILGILLIWKVVGSAIGVRINEEMV